jgi:hypothetical protein
MEGIRSAWQGPAGHLGKEHRRILLNGLPVQPVHDSLWGVLDQLAPGDIRLEG